MFYVFVLAIHDHCHTFCLAEEGCAVTDKELHKLGRKELLQLLVAQSREADNARQKLAETQEELGQLQETYERLRGRLDDKDAQIRKLREIIRQERQAQGLPADGAVPEEQTETLPQRQPEPYLRRPYQPVPGPGAPAMEYERPYAEPPYGPYGDRAASAQSQAYVPAPEPAQAYWGGRAAPAYYQPRPEAPWQQGMPYSQYPAYPVQGSPAPRGYDRGEYPGGPAPWQYPPEAGGCFSGQPQPYAVPKANAGAAAPEQTGAPPEEKAKTPLPAPVPAAGSPEPEKRKEAARGAPGKFPESLVNPLSLPVVGSLREPPEAPPAPEEPPLTEKPWWQIPAPRHAQSPGRPPAHQVGAKEPVSPPRPAPKAPAPRQQPQPPLKPKAPAPKESVQVLRVVNGKIVELG